MADVDMMRSNNGPLIIEVNSAQDSTGMIINFAVKGKAHYDQGEGIWLKSSARPLLANKIQPEI